MSSNPASGTNESGRWDGPLHIMCPIDPNRTCVEDQLMIAELRLNKKRKKRDMLFYSKIEHLD